VIAVVKLSGQTVKTEMEKATTSVFNEAAGTITKEASVSRKIRGGREALSELGGINSLPAG